MTTRTALPLIIVDTREQRPWSFGDLPTVRRALVAGDYSVEGLEDRVAIERKEFGDLLGSVTFERERFERELEILAGYERAAIIVEGDLETVIEWKYRSSANPSALVGSFASFWARYAVPVVFCGSRRNAEILAARMLTKAAKHLLAAPPPVPA